MRVVDGSNIVAKAGELTLRPLTYPTRDLWLEKVETLLHYIAAGGEIAVRDEPSMDFQRRKLTFVVDEDLYSSIKTTLWPPHVPTRSRPTPPRACSIGRPV